MKYSKDYQFFLKNQIGVATTNNRKCVTWFSRLEKKTFKRIDDRVKISDEKINEECFSIHKNLVTKTHR